MYICTYAGVEIEPISVRECHFVGSSLRALKDFPDEVRGAIGHALHEAQLGLEPSIAKALRGFGGRGVLELVEDHDGETYRAVYTVRFVDAVYVLHCFQKKSKRGIATPKHDIDLIGMRLKAAEADHLSRQKQGVTKDERHDHS